MNGEKQAALFFARRWRGRFPWPVVGGPAARRIGRVRCNNQRRKKPALLVRWLAGARFSGWDGDAMRGKNDGGVAGSRGTGGGGACRVRERGR